MPCRIFRSLGLELLYAVEIQLVGRLCDMQERGNGGGQVDGEGSELGPWRAEGLPKLSRWEDFGQGWREMHGGRIGMWKKADGVGE